MMAHKTVSMDDALMYEDLSTTESLLEQLESDICDRLRRLDLSQQSIETESDFVMTLALPPGVEVSFLAEMIVRFILRTHRTKKLPYIYLANDLIQKSMIKRKKQKSPELANFNDFHEAFAPPRITNVLTKLFTMLRESESFT